MDKFPKCWVWVPFEADSPPRPHRTILPRQEVEERNFAWMRRYRCLSSDYEQLPAKEEAWIYAGMTQLMARRCAQ